MAKKTCATAPAVVKPRKSHRASAPKCVTPDAHTPPETASCVMIKVLSELAPSQISKTPEKTSATLTKVLNALDPLASSKKKRHSQSDKNLAATANFLALRPR